MTISGKTRIIALLGYPVEHSLSPAMHNRAFADMGLDYCYTAFPVRPDMVREAVGGIRALDLAGVNVTVPHKEAVMPFLDVIDSEASFIGAVNTVVNRDGKLTGYNTDGRGFMKSLEEEGIDVSGKSVMLVGTGGGARAISYYLSEKTSALYLFDIDTEKATRLADDLKINRNNIHRLDSADTIGEMDVVINATPLGLKPGDPLPIDISKLKPSQTVVDLIYKDTPLQTEASRVGCKTFNGLGMLLWQGVLASELWTGRMPPHEIMKAALLEGLGQ
jgi:shikimate dehydrogenase